MNFLTLSFFVFFLLYLMASSRINVKRRKYLLAVFNCIFYGWMMPKMLIYPLTASVLTYIVSLKMDKSQGKKRKIWLTLGLLGNFGFLFLCKYLVFFAGIFGAENPESFSISQPLGVSFFTFVVTAYLIDIYKGKIKPAEDFVSFFAFSTFFPSVISGPIERADNLLTQIEKGEKADLLSVKEGFLRFVWGAFKKAVVADNLGIMVDSAYKAFDTAGGAVLLFAAVAYSFQIYYDFSGYSDMAIGAAEMMGIRLRENFLCPYYSSSVKEFWKKWHISLTSWFRDYIYFPLGGSRKGKIRTYLNILIVFSVSGLWHGASWNFVIWGLLNGLYQVMGQIFKPITGRIKGLCFKKDSLVPKIIGGLFTFGLITVSWVFFRAETLDKALLILKKAAFVPIDRGVFDIALFGVNARGFLTAVFFTVCVFGAEYFIKDRKWAASLSKTRVRYYVLTGAVIMAVLIFGVWGPAFDAQDFVYFKF